jgi:hypothetical protein
MSNEMLLLLLQPLQQPQLAPQAQVRQPLQALVGRVRQALLRQPQQQLQHLVNRLRKLLPQPLLQRQQRLWPPVAHKGQRQQRQRQLHHTQMVLQSVASRLQQLQPQQLLQVVVHLPLVLLVQPVELIKVEKQVLHQLLQQL